MTSQRQRAHKRTVIVFAALLSAWCAAAFDMTKSADDYFHGGAMNYLTNNIPAALDIVTNGLAQYPENEKLQKLEALLKQQQQQQQQQQDKNQQEDQQQGQQNKGQQPQNQDQQQQSKPEEQKQQDQQSKQDAQQKEKEQQQAANQAQQQQSNEQGQPHAAQEQEQMTPAQALRVLDSTKGDEQVLPLQQLQKPPPPNRTMKDW